MEYIKKLEHTADLGFEIKARDIESGFKMVAIELSNTMVISKENDTSAEIDFEIDEQELLYLFVSFLEEIIFLYETKGFVLNNINFKEISEKKIKGKFLGFIDKNISLNHGLSIKGITYYNIEVKKINGFYAKFYVDV